MMIIIKLFNFTSFNIIKKETMLPSGISLQ